MTKYSTRIRRPSKMIVFKASVKDQQIINGLRDLMREFTVAKIQRLAFREMLRRLKRKEKRG